MRKHSLNIANHPMLSSAYWLEMASNEHHHIEQHHSFSLWNFDEFFFFAAKYALFKLIYFSMCQVFVSVSHEKNIKQKENFIGIKRRKRNDLKCTHRHQLQQHPRPEPNYKQHTSNCFVPISLFLQLKERIVLLFICLI